MKNYYHIAFDPCFIAQRLKEIDKGYFVVFNKGKGKYEVHCLGQKDGTYCFTVPYNTLDSRTLLLARKTRCENIAKVIEEIEKSNEKLQKDNLKNAKNKLQEILL